MNITVFQRMWRRTENGRERCIRLLIRVRSLTCHSGGVVELDFSKSKIDVVNLYSQRNGNAWFVLLVSDTASPYVDSRPLLAAGKPEMHSHKSHHVLNDKEIGQFSDEVTVTWRP